MRLNRKTFVLLSLIIYQTTFVISQRRKPATNSSNIKSTNSTSKIKLTNSTRISSKKFPETKKQPPTTTTMKSIKKENPRKLYLFCKNCTLDRRLWKNLEKIFGSYLNETPPEFRPSIILSKNYTFAEEGFGITEFPAFVFVDKNETSTFDASTTPMNFTYLNYWLSSTNTEGGEINLINLLSMNTNEINQINFYELIVDSQKLWLILLKNDKNDDPACKIYDWQHLKSVENKVFVENSLKINSAIMKTINLNYVFVRKRLHIDPNAENCPIYVKILNNKFLTFNGWDYIDGVNGTLTKNLVDFIKEPFDERIAKDIGEDLTDSEYLFHDLQFKIDDNLRNKTFIVIGITGGISVIALAVSIFWGLKSSSFETKRVRQ